MLDSRILTCSPTQSKKGLAMVKDEARRALLRWLREECGDEAADCREDGIRSGREDGDVFIVAFELGHQAGLAARDPSLAAVYGYEAGISEGLERAAVIAESLPGVPPPPRSGGSFAAARANQCELVATAIRAEKGRSNGQG
jgi:hypothetical protein